MAGTVPLQSADAGSWWDWITNYDQTLANFNAAYAALQAQGPYIQANHPELLSQYNQLMSDAQSHANTLNQLKATRDYVYSWLQWLGSGAQAGVNFVTSAAQNTYDYLTSLL